MKNTIFVCLVMVLLMAFDTQAAIHHNKVNKQKVLQIETAEMCLAKSIYFEAGSEPYEGKMAVAQVIMNRVEHPSFPKTVCGVVHQSSTKVVEKQTVRMCQFSWFCEPRKIIHYESDNWQQSAKVAKIFLTNEISYDRFTDTVLFFHEKHLPFNWKARYVSVATIGNHIFYRTKDGHERRNKEVFAHDRRNGSPARV
jgi:spore germination cell wall hydrolase CwlJ-like protein